MSDLPDCSFPIPSRPFSPPSRSRTTPITNITGFKNARVDQLCKDYDKMFDVKARIRAIQEIDSLGN